MSARVEDVPEGLPRKYTVRRWVAGVVVVAVALVGAAVVAAVQSDASTPVAAQSPVSHVSATRTATITPVVSRECQEDEPCWNPCKVGKSPCDGSALLPYGARWHVGVTFNPGSVECWQGWVLTQVTVYVYGAEGGLLAQSGMAVGCAPGGDAFASNGVGAMLPELYRQAASAL